MAHARPEGKWHLPFTCSSNSCRLAFQRAQGLVVYIPLLQDCHDGFGAKTGTGQLPKDAGHMPLILRLLQPLFPQILASLLLFVYAFVGGFYSLLDHVAMHTAGFQFRDNPHAAELLIVASQRRISRRLLRIVEISLIFAPPDSKFDQ